MDRPNWETTFINICDQLKNRSTCHRLKTSSLIIRDQRIISMGYNGTPSGKTHCEDHFQNSKYDLKIHHEWSILNEIHAEMNAILFAAREGMSVKDCDLYTLFSPCIQCSKSIVVAGIKRVYYRYLYQRDQDGIVFLQENNVECIKL